MNKFPNLPSIIWVILLPLGLIIFIGGIMLLFYLLANIEGIASIIMLIAGFVVFKSIAFSSLPEMEADSKYGSLFLAGAIVFFALMGIAIDQTGNPIYNKPIDTIFCQEGSHLNRNVIMFNPLPGRTDMIQDYACIKDGFIYYQISLFEIITVRFVEYVLIGYVLFFINRILLYRQKHRRKNNH